MDFFDKMKDGISKGIDTIGTKGKELMEDTQTQLQISSLKDKRKKSLEELGALAFALFQKGALADEGVKAACEAIGSLDQQIAAKQALLAQSHQQDKPAASAGAGAALVKCACGAENASGIKFCPSCGKQLG
jgi:membrane protease subunit (stomatin/prohibitin family)